MVGEQRGKTTKEIMTLLGRPGGGVTWPDIVLDPDLFSSDLVFQIDPDPNQVLDD
jgi:hypothetical protein